MQLCSGWTDADLRTEVKSPKAGPSEHVERRGLIGIRLVNAFASNAACAGGRGSLF